MSRTKLVRPGGFGGHSLPNDSRHRRRPPHVAQTRHLHCELFGVGPHPPLKAKEARCALHSLWLRLEPTLCAESSASRQWMRRQIWRSCAKCSTPQVCPLFLRPKSFVTSARCVVGPSESDQLITLISMELVLTLEQVLFRFGFLHVTHVTQSLKLLERLKDPQLRIQFVSAALHVSATEWDSL